MSYSIFKTATLAVSSSVACLACGSDQSGRTNTADDVSIVQAPAEPAGAQLDSTSRAGAEAASAPSAASPNASAERTTGNQLATDHTSTPVPAPRLSESQVAMVTDLVNAAEIEQGKLAQTKAKSAEVRGREWGSRSIFWPVLAEWGIDKTETGDTSPSLKTEFVHEGDKSRLCARRRLLKDEGGVGFVDAHP